MFKGLIYIVLFYPENHNTLSVERFLSVAIDTLPTHEMGHGQHPDVKMDNDDGLCNGILQQTHDISLSPGSSLQWRHNGRHGFSDHQPRECLLSRLFNRRSKKTSKLRVTGHCAGNSWVTGEVPAQRVSNAENHHHLALVWQKMNDVIFAFEHMHLITHFGIPYEIYIVWTAAYFGNWFSN